MKRLCFTAAVALTSAMGFAQTVLWNGEDRELETNGGAWDRCSPVVVENPDKSGVNTSEKCMKITVTGTEWSNGDLALPINQWMPKGGFSFASKRLSVMIKKEGNSNVKIELSDPTDSSTNYWKNVAAWYDGNNEWRKVYFDFSQNGEFDHPGVLCVYPTTDKVEGALTVYIDNIQIEDAPTVDGVALNSIEGNSLSGNLKLTGSWLKGVCNKVEGDTWTEVGYDDFNAIESKLTDNVTSVDLRGATVKDVDVNKFFKSPNTLVYADFAYNHNNVVADGKASEIVLTDAHPFNAVDGFTAANVKVTRTVRNGINSFVLPFAVSAAELGAEKVATFDAKNDASVVFNKADEVKANTPFVTVGLTDGTDNKEFSFNNKEFEKTPDSFEGMFKGVYAHKSGEGLYGVTPSGNFQKGNASAYFNPFRAYLEISSDASAPQMISFNDETGIGSVDTTVADEAVYSLSGVRVAKTVKGAKLQRGVYVVGGKKVVVK